MKAVAFYDTAGSVKQLVELRDKHAAAIASEQAAATYGAEILARGIEDDPGELHALLPGAARRRSARRTPIRTR